MSLKCPSCGYDNEDDALCCNLCQRLFRKEPRQESPPAPPPRAATGEDPGARFSAIAGEFVKNLPAIPVLNNSGIILDYSPASVAALDELINLNWGERGASPGAEGYAPTAGQMNLIMLFGCYFGEVLRQLGGGRWAVDPQKPRDPLFAAVEFQDGGKVFAIGKVFKRFKNGVEDSLFPFLDHLFGKKVIPQPAGDLGFRAQADRFLAASALPPAVSRRLASEFYGRAAGFDPSLRPEMEKKSREAMVAQLKSMAPAPARFKPGEVSRAAERQASAMREKTPADFSPASLAAADAWMETAWFGRDEAYRKEEAESWGEQIEGLGFYVGEVICRGLGAKWKEDLDRMPSSRVVLADGRLLDPWEWTREAGAGRGSLWARWTALKPGADPGLGAAADWFSAREKPREAARLYRLAAEADPSSPAAWVGLARSLSRLDLWKEALEPSKKACSLSEGNAEAWELGAGVLWELGKTEGAWAALERCLALEPGRGEARRLRGRILLGQGKAAEAAADFDAALARDPERHDAMLGKAEALLALGRFEEASAAVDRYRGRDPRVWFVRGECWERMKKPAAALTAFGKFLEKPPAGREREVERARGRLPVLEARKAADEFAKAGRAAEYVEAMGRVHQMDPEDGEVLRQLGMALSQTGRHEEALRRLDELVARAPGDIVALHTRGVVLAQAGRPDEALLSFDMAIEKDLRAMDAWKGKATLLRKLGRAEDMRRHVEGTLSRDSAHAEAWFYKGLAEKEAGRKEEALGAFRKFLANLRPDVSQNLLEAAQKEIWPLENPGKALQPREAAPWFQKANQLSVLQRFGEAAAAFEKALEFYPVDANGWAGKGACLAFLGRHDEALECLRRSLELDPRSVVGWKSRGSMLAQLNRPEEALSCWDSALRWQPGDAEALNGRAWALYHLKRFDESVAAFDRNIAAAPADRMVVLEKAAILERAGRLEEALAAARGAFSNADFLSRWRREGPSRIAGLVSAQAAPEFSRLLKDALGG